MPISSSAGRARVSSTSNKRPQQTENWSNVNKSFAAIKRNQQRIGSRQIKASQQQQQHQDARFTSKASHISPPASLTSTSAALRSAALMASASNLASTIRHSPSPDGHSTNFLSTSAHSLHLAQPVSLMGDPLAQPHSDNQEQEQEQEQQQVSHVAVSSSSSGPKSSSYLVNNLQYSVGNRSKQQSFASLTSHQPQEFGPSSSTMQLQPGALDGSAAAAQQAGRGRHLSIRQSVNLKYVKTLIVVLIVIDLLITVFVHQFSTSDQVALWFIAQFKLRMSVVNLVASAIWSIILIGGILFDSYPILLLSCIIDSASFVLLLILSTVHFTRRIDYNTVNLTSLLALLFSIIVLHVYLLAMLALTIYLMLAVKRRRKSPSR